MWLRTILDVLCFRAAILLTGRLFYGGEQSVELRRESDIFWPSPPPTGRHMRAIVILFAAVIVTLHIALAIAGQNLVPPL